MELSSQNSDNQMMQDEFATPAPEFDRSTDARLLPKNVVYDMFDSSAIKHSDMNPDVDHEQTVTDQARLF